MQSRYRPHLAAVDAALTLKAGIISANTAVISGEITGYTLTVAGQAYRIGPYSPTTTLKQRQVVRLRHGWARGRRTATRVPPETAKPSASRSLRPAKPRQASS